MWTKVGSRTRDMRLIRRAGMRERCGRACFGVFGQKPSYSTCSRVWAAATCGAMIPSQSRWLRLYVIGKL